MVSFVYSLTLDFYICRLYEGFKIQSCSFVKMILMNKTCKYHKLLLVSELIFCNTSKANGKFVFFDEGTRMMLL